MANDEKKMPTRYVIHLFFEWYQKVKICFIIQFFLFLFFCLFQFLPIVFVVIIPSRNGYYYLSSLEAHFFIFIFFILPIDLCWIKNFRKKKHDRLLKRPLVDQYVYRAVLFEEWKYFHHHKNSMIRFFLFCKQQILPVPLGVFGFYVGV